MAIAIPLLHLLRRPFESSQYTSLAFGQRCAQAGVRPSMGTVGDCFDNAMGESFFATLECELLSRRSFKTQTEARMAVFDFIEGFYNPHRRHSALGYLSPCEYERLYRDGTSETMKSSTALRTAWPLKAAGAVHGAAVSTEESLTLSGSLSNPHEERAEKLVLKQHPDPASGKVKSVT